MAEAAAIKQPDRGPQPAMFTWYPDLTGRVCVIVASGPSAQDVKLAPHKEDDRIYWVAINESWRLVPWGQALYGCDAQWWYKRRNEWKKFPGLKITQDKHVGELLIGEDIKRVYSVRGVEHAMLDQPGYIGWGGNSGFQAINLALHWQPSAVILVGFDMNLDRGAHWHGQHVNGLHNPRPGHVGRWARCVDRAYGVLRRQGIKGYNTCPTSSLEAWPKMTFEEALADAYG